MAIHPAPELQSSLKRGLLRVIKMIGAITLRSRRQFAVAFLLVLIGALALAQPIKNHAWNVIQQAGDNALAARQFDTARLEYLKLRLIRPHDPQLATLNDRLAQAESNILTLRQFYLDRGETVIVAQMDQATATYPDPQAATTACQGLFKDNAADLALICIQNTTKTWPIYRDGWITQALVAKSLNNTDLYTSSRQHALELDPTINLPLK